jgi:hypothetical protein
MRPHLHKGQDLVVVSKLHRKDNGLDHYCALIHENLYSYLYYLKEEC